MNYFEKKGRELLANGYLIVPIRPGEKRPALASWQHSRLSAVDLPRYPGCGVGILTGQGAFPVVGVDIDISHVGLNNAVVAWCRANLGFAPERVGSAPRILLAYRTATPLRKGFSTAFFDPADPVKLDGKRNEQRVELLGSGQQFVSYHTHPDTKQPYAWVDVMGGLSEMRADELTLVTEAQLDGLLAEVHRLVTGTPGLEVLTAGDGPAVVRTDNPLENGGLDGVTPNCGLSIDEARELLKWHDASEHGHWVQVGAALHHEFDGAAAALSLWDEWSSAAANWQEGVCTTRWRSFGKGGHSPITARWLIKLAGIAKADAQADEQRGQFEQIKALIAGAKDTFELTGVIADRVQKLAPGNAGLQAQVLHTLQAKFLDLSGGVKLPVAEAKRLALPQPAAAASRDMSKLPEGAAPGVRPLSEFGMAERMLDSYGSGLMFTPETARWYSWTGAVWRQAQDVEVQFLAMETVRALPGEAVHHQGSADFYRFCAESQRARMVSNMVSLAAASPRVMVPNNELNKHAQYLGAPNGVIDLVSGALLPPDPGLRLTQSVSVPYDPGAPCPVFERVVSEVFSGDEEMAEFFQRLVGYSASGKPVQQLLVIPFGSGANGKSTVLNAIRRALGGYARSADASSFVSDGKSAASAGGARGDLVRLSGSRFVYVSEPDEGGELREGTVKSLTGDDAISARELYSKTTIEIEPTWTMWMPTNHRPIIKGTDLGIWRRICLLPFSRNFEKDPHIKRDLNLADKLAAETAGILAWIVRGYQAYLVGGLKEPEAVTSAKGAYKNSMDTMAGWLNECCDIGSGLVTSHSDLWASWEQYARRNGMLTYCKSSIALSRRLEGRFERGPTTGGMLRWAGIRVKTDFAPV